MYFFKKKVQSDTILGNILDSKVFSDVYNCIDNTHQYI